MWFVNNSDDYKYESPQEKFLRVQTMKKVREGINKKGGTGYLMNKKKNQKNSKNGANK